MQTRNSSYNKMFNRRIIVRSLFQKKLSRAEFSRLTGLSRAAITMLADELIGEGVIRECGIDENSVVGRNPSLLEIVPDCYRILSVDIARDGCSVGVVSFGGEVLAAQRVPVAAEAPPQEIVEQICGILKHLADTVGEAPILGLGITTPGPVDTTHGRVDDIPDFELWSRFSIVDEFKKHVDYDITFERDANAVSLAELYFGYGRQCDDFMVVLSYTGVGLGVVKNRRLYSGKFGLTPELGHVTVDMNGGTCICGNRGCLHDYYGVNIILRQVRRDFPQVTGWPEIVDRAYGGEQYFINVVDRSARVLSIGVIDAVNLFAIDTVIISGFNTYRPDMFLEALQGYVRASHIARNFYDVNVYGTQMQKYENLVGAAAGVIEKNLNIH